MTDFETLAAEMRGRMMVQEIMLFAIMKATAAQLPNGEQYLKTAMADAETYVAGLNSDGTPDSDKAIAYARESWANTSSNMMGYLLANTPAARD